MYIEKLKDGTINLTAPVMIPGAPDCDYERGEPPLTRQQIQDFQKSYENYRFVDDEHELTITGKVRGYKEKSYLLKEPITIDTIDGTLMTYPTGTWMLTSHLTDPLAISKAEKGEYTGYSPSVRSKDTADKYLELINASLETEAQALKSRSLSGLIKDVPNPVVLSVSLVSKPCQSGSKFCKLKRNGEIMADESNFKTKVLDAMGLSDVADVEALKGQVSTLESKIEEIKKDNAEALKSMKEELLTGFQEALSEFADKSKKEDDADDDESGDDSKTDDSKGDNSNKDTDAEGSESNDDEDDDDKKKAQADKSEGSKQGHVHNGSDKSQEVIEDTYEFLGRYPDGTCKNYNH